MWKINNRNPKSITILNDQGHILARIIRADVPDAEEVAKLMAEAPKLKEAAREMTKLFMQCAAKNARLKEEIENLRQSPPT